MNVKYEYEVALSFAGEQRGYVSEVAKNIQARGIAVFFDEFENLRLWGKDLPTELHKVYEGSAKHVVMFISKEYVDKSWTNHERRSALARLICDRPDYILPVRFDDTPVPGLPSSTFYQDANALTPAELAVMICEKIGIQPFEGKASQVPPPASTAPAGLVEFNYGSYNGCFVIGKGPSMFETMWTHASASSIHVYNDPGSINGVAIAPHVKTIEEISDANTYDFSSRSRTAKVGEIVVFRNVKGMYAAAHIKALEPSFPSGGILRLSYIIATNGHPNFR